MINRQKKHFGSLLIYVLLATAYVLNASTAFGDFSINFTGNTEIYFTADNSSSYIGGIYRNGSLFQGIAPSTSTVVLRDAELVRGQTYRYEFKYFCNESPGCQTWSNGYILYGEVIPGGSSVDIIAGHVSGTLPDSRTLTDTWELYGPLIIPSGRSLTVGNGGAIVNNGIDNYGTFIAGQGSSIQASHIHLYSGSSFGADGAALSGMNVANHYLGTTVASNTTITGITNCTLSNNASFSADHFSIFKGNTGSGSAVLRLTSDPVMIENNNLSNGSLRVEILTCPANAVSIKSNNISEAAYGGGLFANISADLPTGSSCAIWIENNNVTDFGLTSNLGPAHNVDVSIQNNTFTGRMKVQSSSEKLTVEKNSAEGLTIYGQQTSSPPAYSSKASMHDFRKIVRGNHFSPIGNSTSSGLDYNTTQVGIKLGHNDSTAITANMPATDFLIEGNTITCNSGASGYETFGIAATNYSANNWILNNVVNQCASGIKLFGGYLSADYGTVNYNLIKGNTVSVDENATVGGLFTNGTISSDCIAIEGNATGNILAGNKVSGCYNGIYIRAFNATDTLQFNTLKDNIVEQNVVALWLGGYPQSNEIYNNLFRKGYSSSPTADTTYVVRSFISGNRQNSFNTAKTAGLNIVGGPFLGGNCWSDYHGVDADKDGIGDTAYTPGSGNVDNYPLMLPFIVNTADDEPDADTADGKCDTNLTTSGDQCSLRAAIMEANARQGVVGIIFDIPDVSVPTIQPSSPLPSINKSISLNAVTQKGGAVVVDGTNAGADANGLFVQAGDLTVKSLSITGFKQTGIKGTTTGKVVLEDISITDNLGFGVQVDNDLYVNMNPGAGTRTGPAKFSTISRNGFSSAGGGIASTQGNVEGAWIDASDNSGPGIYAKKSIWLRVVKANHNKGPGIQSWVDDIIIQPTERSVPDEVIGNEGPGMMSGFSSLFKPLGSGAHGEGKNIDIMSDIIVRDNAGWGIFTNGGSISLNDNLGIRYVLRTSAVTGNGDSTKPCRYVGGSGTLKTIEACGGGGMGAGLFLDANYLDVTGNKGPGIVAKTNITVRGIKANNNAGPGIQSLTNDITIGPAEFLSEIIGNEGPGVLAGFTSSFIPDKLNHYNIHAGGVRVENNAGWGLLSTTGSVVINAVDIDDPRPYLSQTSYISGNGDQTRKCSYFGENFWLKQCVNRNAGGVGSNQYFTGNMVEITANKGLGLRVGSGVTYHTGKDCNNTGGNLLLVNIQGNMDISNVDFCDADGDGVSGAVEDAAPNSGDANGDGVLDSQQQNVVSMPRPGGGSYVALAVAGAGASQQQAMGARSPSAIQPLAACTVVQDAYSAEESPDDPLYVFPYGLVGFTAPCSSADIKLIFHDVSDLTGLTYRRYGPYPSPADTPQWYELPGVSFATEVIAGKTVATVSFQLTDGGMGDDTGADGKIIVRQGGLARFDATAPLAAATSAAGDKISVTFGLEIADPAGKQEQFIVTVDGMSGAVTAAARNATDPRMIELTLEFPITFGQTISLSYSAGDVQSTEGGMVSSFSEWPVANAIPPMPGDVNNDRLVDLADAILCLQMTAGIDMDGIPTNTYGDVNNNGRIGAEEAVFVLQHISGLRP